MVLTVTDIWKTFIVERDLRRNIATTMEEAKQRFSNKLKVTKRTNTKATVAKTQSTNAGPETTSSYYQNSYWFHQRSLRFLLNRKLQKR